MTAGLVLFGGLAFSGNMTPAAALDACLKKLAEAGKSLHSQVTSQNGDVTFSANTARGIWGRHEVLRWDRNGGRTKLSWRIGWAPKFHRLTLANGETELHATTTVAAQVKVMEVTSSLRPFKPRPVLLERTYRYDARNGRRIEAPSPVDIVGKLTFSLGMAETVYFFETVSGLDAYADDKAGGPARQIWHQTQIQRSKTPRYFDVVANTKHLLLVDAHDVGPNRQIIDLIDIGSGALLFHRDVPGGTESYAEDRREETERTLKQVGLLR